MAPKRKSDVFEEDASDGPTPTAAAISDNEKPSAKKTRKSSANDASGSKTSTGGKGKKTQKTGPSQNWWEIELEGEDTSSVPVYDDCNDIRRKIRALLKTPGFKITHWLEQIGKINSNSYNRFMKLSGPTGGAENGTYYAAYVYFEKVRIAEGKKKSAKRLRTEQESRGGLELRDRKWVWVPA